MGQGKQAKILTDAQQRAVLAFLATSRHPIRNTVIFLLSAKAGLRAREIAALTWGMVCDAEGLLGDVIALPNSASKGDSGGRTIPLNKTLRAALDDLKAAMRPAHSDRIVQMERSKRPSAQVIVNAFARWYSTLGLVGASSHSGRRSFITQAARRIGTVGGSLRDVQSLAGHSSLATTQRYIDIDAAAQRRIVDLV